MLGEIRGEVRFKENLSFHTSLRIGGPADVFVMARDVEDIRLALLFAEQEQLPVCALGGGNNLLVRDHGLRGVVIKLEGCLGRAEFRGNEVIVGAGMSLSALIREASALSLGGLECLIGIPATIGGALAMDAGGPDGRISDFVSAVYFLRSNGEMGEFKRGTGSYDYRMFELPPDAIIVGCRLELQRRQMAEIQKEIKRRLKIQKLAYPLALASAGPIWKNPTGETAAKLIERVGLRGKRLTHVEISRKHANFIINRGGATALDVLALMELTRKRVRAMFGITLEPEIRIIG